MSHLNSCILLKGSKVAILLATLIIILLLTQSSINHAKWNLHMRKLPRDLMSLQRRLLGGIFLFDGWAQSVSCSEDQATNKLQKRSWQIHGTIEAQCESHQVATTKQNDDITCFLMPCNSMSSAVIRLVP